MLELLEGTREHLATLFADLPDVVDVVIHGSREQLYAAHPQLTVLTRLTAPAARRYLTGWAGSRELHMLAPRHLRSRASNVPGSREMALRAPAALLTQLAVGQNNPRLPPPFRPTRIATLRSWAWLWFGAGQFLSGQTSHARPAIARRLHEGSTPSYPPAPRDALLLGGSILHLIGTTDGEGAVARLCLEAGARGWGTPEEALRRLLGDDGAGRWRTHLTRMVSTVHLGEEPEREWGGTPERQYRNREERERARRAADRANRRR